MVGWYAPPPPPCTQVDRQLIIFKHSLNKTHLRVTITENVLDTKDPWFYLRTHTDYSTRRLRDGSHGPTQTYARRTGWFSRLTHWAVRRKAWEPTGNLMLSEAPKEMRKLCARHLRLSWVWLNEGETERERERAHPTHAHTHTHTHTHAHTCVIHSCSSVWSDIVWELCCWIYTGAFDLKVDVSSPQCFLLNS